MERIPLNNPDHVGSADADPQRHSDRDSLLLTATLRIAGAKEVQVRVRNLSDGGMMAEYTLPVASGVPVAVDLRGIGTVTGKIAWAAEGRIGIAFDRRIDPMLARKPVGQGATTPHYIKPIIPRR